MKKLLLFFTLLFTLGVPAISFAANTDIRITTEDRGRDISNPLLNEMGDGDFISPSQVWGWERGIKNLLITIAKDMKNVVLIIISVIVIVMVLRLFFGDNSDEDQTKLKNGILWLSIWIIVMQSAYSVYYLLFDRPVNMTLWRGFQQYVIEPFTDMLLLFASFVFIAMGIYAFYKIVTAWGDDDKISKGKSTIIQAIIWFIVIKLADIVVKNTFEVKVDWVIWTTVEISENITGNAKIIFEILYWINTFVAIAIVIMIIYAGFLVLTSGWDSDKYDKAKKILLYIAIGLLILFGSYLILTFFITPQLEGRI